MLFPCAHSAVMHTSMHDARRWVTARAHTDVVSRSEFQARGSLFVRHAVDRIVSCNLCGWFLASDTQWRAVSAVFAAAAFASRAALLRWRRGLRCCCSGGVVCGTAECIPGVGGAACASGVRCAWLGPTGAWYICAAPLLVVGQAVQAKVMSGYIGLISHVR
jgi:hypothetical protein